ncbi:MAG: glycosyltransferase, partial [Pirellulaceae bacterium]|nr:glycosyltransferase [Pirellulaceae bacterium]
MNAACPLGAASLRVLLVSTQKAWHGGEDQAWHLASGLRARGHHCRILARSGGTFAARLARDDFEVVPYSTSTPLASLAQARRLARGWRPDVVHFNDAHAVTRAGLALLGCRRLVRVAARRVDFPLRSAWPYRWLTDHVVCVSQAVSEVCRESGVPPHKLCVVHDGVDPRRVAAGDRQRGRDALDLGHSDLLLLTVARLTDHKGHRYLLEALPAILRQFPQVTLALAGDGELRESLAAQAERLGIAPSVRFLGFRHDVPDLLRAADLFVLPSHLEGLCTSIIDAMLADCPVVTTTAGGIPDLVGAREPGELPVAWSVPPRVPAALAAAVVQALSDP